MLQYFIQHLQQFVSLNDMDIQFIKQIIPVQSFHKRELLLAEGEISKAFYFNLSGFVRLFYINKGEEKTAYFYPEKTFISAYASFTQQIPSQLNLQATESTTLAIISLEASRQLLAYSPKFEILARVAMEEELINHQEIIASLLTLNPEERYFHLLDKNPAIFQRVPQRQIASYIGVTAESLSRIKKRHQQKP